MRNDGATIYIGYLANEEHEMIINEIYEIGKSDNYVQEDGFGVFKSSNGNWSLIKTPEGRYTVPHTVAGVTVDAVDIDCISGEPIFDKAYKLSCVDVNWWKPKLVEVITMDYEFIFENLYYANNTIIDLSECGDDVQIPDYYLNYFNSSSDSLTIYVSPAVKERYPNYDNIVEKSSID